LSFYFKRATSHHFRLFHLEKKEEKQAKAMNCIIFLERFDEMSRKDK
jgi:hypothetical protein